MIHCTHLIYSLYFFIQCFFKNHMTIEKFRHKQLNIITKAFAALLSLCQPCNDLFILVKLCSDSQPCILHSFHGGLYRGDLLLNFKTKHWILICWDFLLLQILNFINFTFLLCCLMWFKTYQTA